MKEFVEVLIKALVDKPAEVKVEEIIGKNMIIFELRVGAGDFGKVVGKKGQNITAIRTLANAMAAKQGKRILIEILE